MQDVTEEVLPRAELLAVVGQANQQRDFADEVGVLEQLGGDQDDELIDRLQRHSRQHHTQVLVHALVDDFEVLQEQVTILHVLQQKVHAFVVLLDGVAPAIDTELVADGVIGHAVVQEVLTNPPATGVLEIVGAGFTVQALPLQRVDLAFLCIGGGIGEGEFNVRHD